jgi:hypothetical protein
MAIPSSTAKQLCTQAELSLFTESQTRNVKNLNAQALKTRIARCRKLRDKYKQLANRQDREARAKQEPRRRQAAQGSKATRKKEQLFAESLVRFQRQLAKAETADAKPVKTAKKKVVTEKKVATTSAPAKKVTTKKKVAVKKAVTKKETAKTKVPARSAKKKVVLKKKALVPLASKRATTKAKKAKFTASGLVRKQKHRSAENRRGQARRDAR